ncbi:MAG TPA: hypothetical protein VGC54_02110 [Planctomycetota bacterium]
MRIPYVLTAAFLLVSGVTLHRAATLQGASLPPQNGQDLLLLQRIPASRLPPLFADWFSLQDRVVLPAGHEGCVHAPRQVEYLSRDALTLSEPELLASLAAAGPRSLDAAVRRPRDETLLMSWDPATTLVEFHAAQLLDPSERPQPPHSTLSIHERGWPLSEGKPRSQFAPQSLSWQLTEWTRDPFRDGFRNGERPAGIGFARVRHTGELVFATNEAAADAEDEAGTGSACLVVAREPAGPYWLWFEPSAD